MFQSCESVQCGWMFLIFVQLELFLFVGSGHFLLHTHNITTVIMTTLHVQYASIDVTSDNQHLQPSLAQLEIGLPHSAKVELCWDTNPGLFR